VNIILFIVAGVVGSFCVGVLVGSGLHTMSINRQYQHLAKLVRHYNELNAERDKNPAERISPRIFGSR
jgi:hypothetical protein